MQMMWQRDHTPILHCSSASPNSNRDSSEELSEIENATEIATVPFSSNIWHLTFYLDDAVAYLAGFVVKLCLEILESEDTISKLQIRKTHDMFGENTFKAYLKQNIFTSDTSKAQYIIINRTMQCLPQNIFLVFADHMYDDDPLSNHFLILPS
nr:unnamed protein product [Callosobruchus analis]